MRAATSLLLLTIVPALAQADDWIVDEVRARMGFVGQDGRGAQSQADPVLIDGVPRGREAVSVFQPIFRVGVRQNARVRHTVELPVDIVTSASADALDAVSRASLWTEAGTLQITNDIDVTPDDHVQVLWGMHLEEVMKSGFAGLAYRRDLAQDNATIDARASLFIDKFDPITPQGFDYGYVSRRTILASVGASQILSPTTWVEGRYGLTVQWGVLETTWNAVPVEGDTLPAQEPFPDQRVRHAISGGIAQHLPATHSTLRGRYRFYADDFGARAHTMDVDAYQWFGRFMNLKLSYRLHDQRAVDFFYDRLGPANLYETNLPRTADSDLASFRAHEWGVAVTAYLSRAGDVEGERSISVSFRRYTRPYFDLSIIALGYSRTL